MNEVLPQYDVNSTTWFYLSLLLIVTIFFRFTRFWSLRNLDLALLLTLSPALLFLEPDPMVGNTWLFAASGCLLVRLFCDPLFRRRPRLEQNLNSPGLAFMSICALVFLCTRIAVEPLPTSTLETVKRSENLRNFVDDSDQPTTAGPAPRLIGAPVGVISDAVTRVKSVDGEYYPAAAITGRVMAVLSHMAIVIALFLLGRGLFSDAHTGWAMVLLYLLLPCTFYQACEVIHVLPTALILWAIVVWKKPLISGALLGMACGSLFFPIFLIPLWIAFYGRGHAWKFCGSLAATGAVLLASFALTSKDVMSFTQQVLGTVDWSMLSFQIDQAGGFWGADNSLYRIPLAAGFFVALTLLSIWPRRKSLEYLISASSAIIVATQFWYPQQGSVFLLWYLPLVLVVAFRPPLNVFPPESAPDKSDQKPKTESPKTPETQELVGASPSQAIFR